LIQERLGVPPDEVVFVSSNGFDVAGARSFGLKTVRIERVTPAALRAELTGDGPIGPSGMFRALRSQTENLGLAPDAVVSSLMALPVLVGTIAGDRAMP
jgi:2-haloacid dehalogenase